MTNQMHNSLQLDNIRFSYGETNMLFNIAIAGNQITAIVGPSGSGKSTLLNLIAGFEQPQSGRLFIGGQDMTRALPSERPVSMIFQDNNLFAHLTVSQNVGLGCSPGLKLTAADHEKIAAALDRVGLTGKDKRKPEALSGGERQRVAVARAMVRDKPILLLDEAFGSLGPALRLQMLDLIAEMQLNSALNVLMVTHTPEDAVHLNTNLLFVENGNITVEGPAHELLSETGPAVIKDYMGAATHK